MLLHIHERGRNQSAVWFRPRSRSENGEAHCSDEIVFESITQGCGQTCFARQTATLGWPISPRWGYWVVYEGMSADVRHKNH